MPIFLAAEFAYGTVAEKFALCGRMILTGMGTVFLVLCILWGVIAVFGAVARAKTRRDRERLKAQTAAAPSTEDGGKAPAVRTEPEAPAESEEEAGALIAVITAAIEAYRAAEGAAPGSYRVVSFKRKNTRKSWNGPVDG